ncbi:hypothetical protein FQR65_LT15439 [Abscondita terminalis]|nr:hypothetical protein FQR65_LT15439 [Abscondita terminalis]
MLCPVVCVICYKQTDLNPCSKNCGVSVCSTNCENALFHKQECELINRWKHNDTSESWFNITEVLNSDPFTSIICKSERTFKVVSIPFWIATWTRSRYFKRKVITQLSKEEEDFMRLTCAVAIGLRGLYPLSSLMNHSCVPNTMHNFDSRQNMIVKATTFIPEGHEIFHSYTRFLWGTPVRRSHLARTKHFLCRCVRCEDRSEYGTNLSGILCEKCKNVILPLYASKLNILWKCNACEHTVPNNKVSSILRVLGSRLNSFNETDVDVNDIFKFLNKQLINYLPPNNQISIELKYRLVWILGYNTTYLWSVVKCADIYQHSINKKMLNFNDLFKNHRQCKFINTSLCEIKSSKIGGRGLFAKTNIKPGEIIFKDHPLIIGPRTGKSALFCVSCYKPLQNSACSKNCGLPICSQECEESQIHLKECTFISSRRTKISNKINVYLFRCLTPIRGLLLNKEQQKLLQFFKGHEGSHHGFEVDILKNNLHLSAEEVEELKRICLVLDTNTFEVVLGDEDDTSLKGMYPLSSMLNHSCFPNTTCYFDYNQNMIIKATVFIEKNLEIFHCYTKLCWGTIARQEYLLKTKHFICECDRCRDATEFGTYLNAINCFKCKGMVVPIRKESKTSWICVNCKTTLANKIAGVVLSVLGSRLNNLLKANPKEILEFLNNDFLKYAPACNQIAVQLKFRLIWLYGYCHNYSWIHLSAELVNEKEKICRELLNLLETLRAGSNKMRGLLLYELYCCLREKQKREQDEHNSSKIYESEMNVLLRESQEILKDDVHAPAEIKKLNKISL